MAKKEVKQLALTSVVSQEIVGQIEKIAAQIKSFKITSKASASQADELLALARKKSKEVTAAINAKKEPFKVQVDSYNDLISQSIKPFDAAVKSLAGKLTDYLLEQEEKEQVAKEKYEEKLESWTEQGGRMPQAPKSATASFSSSLVKKDDIEINEVALKKALIRIFKGTNLEGWDEYLEVSRSLLKSAVLDDGKDIAFVTKIKNAHVRTT